MHVVEMLKDELYDVFGDESSKKFLDRVVDYLNLEGFFDYDILKELYDLGEDD
jgi:hypothetical protein